MQNGVRAYNSGSGATGSNAWGSGHGGNRNTSTQHPTLKRQHTFFLRERMKDKSEHVSFRRVGTPSAPGAPLRQMCTFQGAGASNTKIPRETKRAKMRVGEGKKKRENLGSPPFGAPTLWALHPSGPHPSVHIFSFFGAPHFWDPP